MITPLQIKAKNIVGNKLIKFIEANPDKDWDWKHISKKPNITMDLIEANPDKNWGWKKISNNKFTKEYENELQKLKRKQKIIQYRFTHRKNNSIGM
jgi:hypothetical protein